MDGAGLFSGTGTNYFAGDPKPGSSPASTIILGNAVFGPNNTFEAEIGGITPGSDHDFLDVAGTLTLDGYLSVVTLNDFGPQDHTGQLITIMAAAMSLTGEFLNAPPGARMQSDDGLLGFTIYYGPGSPYGANNVVLGDMASIPEPGTLALVGLGVAALLRRRRRR